MQDCIEGGRIQGCIQGGCRVYTCLTQGVYKVAYNVNARSIQDYVQGRQGYYNNYISCLYTSIQNNY